MAEENKVLVSSEALKNTAATFRTKMGDINSAVSAIEVQLKSLKDSTMSDALDSLHDKIVLMQTENLAKFQEVIGKYAEYLETVANTYEKADSDLVTQQAVNVDNSKVFK